MGLVDDRGTAPHGGEGVPGGGFAGELDQAGCAAAERGQVSLFVLVAFPGEESELRVNVRGGPWLAGAGAIALGLHPLAPRGEVALEVGDEVAGGIESGAVG